MFVVLFVLVCLQTCHCEGQNYRNDYMWALASRTYYRLHDLGSDWLKARQICEAEGTTLLIPDSLGEMENLKVLMSNMKAHDTAIYLGIHDRYADGNYVTVKGEPISDTVLDLLWGEGRPDSLNGVEHCVVMTREGLFDDRPCTDAYPFVCKIRANETVYNQPCDIFDMGYFLPPNSIGKKCYKFHEEPLSWHDAYMVCHLEQGSLAIINSPEEAKRVASILTDHQISLAPDPNILLIGFSDLMFPYQYRTTNGQPLEVAGYATFNPIEVEPPGETKLKRCGGITANGLLTVTYCDKPAMFLCETEAKSNEKTIETTNPTEHSTTDTPPPEQD